MAVIIYNIFVAVTIKGGAYMSPRTGRPKSENSMRERVTVRLDKETSKILKEYCEKHNTDKAAAIREGIRKLG